MTTEKFELVMLGESRLTMAELGRRTGLSEDVVYQYFIFGLIDPHVDDPEPLFAEETLVRINKIERIRGDLGVNLQGCGLIIDLLERIDDLEDQLRQLRAQLST